MLDTIAFRAYRQGMPSLLPALAGIGGYLVLDGLWLGLLMGVVGGVAMYGGGVLADHLAKRDLFRVLAPDEIGMGLTESMAMTPAASVSGFYLAHPDAAYFNVGRIGDDQLADWATRCGLSEAEARRDPIGRMVAFLKEQGLATAAEIAAGVAPTGEGDGLARVFGPQFVAMMGAFHVGDQLSANSVQPC